jgi:hypothetical protein
MALDDETVVYEELCLEHALARAVAVAAVEAQQHALRARADLLETLDL